jgi:hypothetical protein
MVGLRPPATPAANWEQVRDDWVRAVTDLVAQVEGWCRDRGWPTRRIDKRMYDAALGEYTVPALKIQVDLLKLLLEPDSRYLTGTDGGANLYVMPDFDDAARLFRHGGGWVIHPLQAGKWVPFELRGDPPAATRAGERPLTAEEFVRAVEAMA